MMTAMLFMLRWYALGIMPMECAWHICDGGLDERAEVATALELVLEVQAAGGMAKRGQSMKV